MSGASIDSDAESGQFLSCPGTPAVDGDDDDGEAFSWKGKSVHNCLAFLWFILRRSPDPDLSPAPAHGSETSPGPSTPRDPANGKESYFEPL
jgi:hypothetical protein